MNLTEFIYRYDALVKRGIAVSEAARLGAPDDYNARISLVAIDGETVKLAWNAVELGYYGDCASLIQECSSAFPAALLFMPDGEFDAWADRVKQELASKDLAESDRRQAQAVAAQEAMDRESFTRLKAKYGE